MVSPLPVVHRGLQVSHQPGSFHEGQTPHQDLAISIPPRDGRKWSIQVEAASIMQTRPYIFLGSGCLFRATF